MSSVDGGVRCNGLWGSRGCRKRREKDHDEGQDGGQDEEGEHPMGGDPSDLKSVGDISGEGNWILLVLIGRACN